MTTPLRTAYGLARRLPLRAAVAALDALARHDGFEPQAVLQLANRYPRARGRRRLPTADDVLNHPDRLIAQVRSALSSSHNRVS